MVGISVGIWVTKTIGPVVLRIKKSPIALFNILVTGMPNAFQTNALKSIANVVIVEKAVMLKKIKVIGIAVN
jgi:stage III sporulation protein SpoIIIAA